MDFTDLPDTAPDFTKLREVFGRLIGAQATIQLGSGEGWKNHAQILLIKIFRHVESIETIFEGVHTSIREKTFPHYVDHASIAVLARTAFETYMMFHFIFCAKPELSRLRHQIWEYAGLRGRQAMHGTVVGRVQWQHVIAVDKKRIQILDHEIRANRIFAQYMKEVQDKVLKKNDAKMGFKWMDLAEESGFLRKYARDMYSHFCSYAHAGLISVLQIHDASDSGHYKKLAGVAISFCALLMGQIIGNYAQLFPLVDQTLKADSEALALLDRWKDLLNRLGDLYEDANSRGFHG